LDNDCSKFSWCCSLQDGEHALKISELEEQATKQGKLVKSLKAERTRFQNGLNEMSKELEVKVKEILQVRSEANQTLK